MGELRSPTRVNAQLQERLREQGLPERLTTSIGNSLDVFLEEDDVRLDERSFRALLRFVSDRRRWVAPGLSINQRGNFIAVWEIPGVVRWSLEFLPTGEIAWTLLEKSSEKELVHQSDTGRPESLAVPQRLRGNIFAE